MRFMDPRRALAALALAAALLPVAGCAQIPSAGRAHSASDGSTAGVSQEPGSRDTSGPVVANGHGWTQAGLDGTIPAPNSCHIRWTAEKEPLPDPKCTPGAVDSAVTQANLKETVCRKGGYTSSVRPPVTLTDPAKLKIMAAYGIPASDASKYELDHLEPLTIGGASDVRNLWPDPLSLIHSTPSSYVHNESQWTKSSQDEGFAANDKDVVESKARTAVCSGAANLDAVQKVFSIDWTQIQLQ
ncbi:hypothetical protein [Sinomonas gamaensis]|uniref:hypothetical protein n=1 Tax=Sinomonas gamaensis TaxID=2565624 RepID=UPI001108464E|nr:hypothetical protein [Sinomonas gamaensis]